MIWPGSWLPQAREGVKVLHLFSCLLFWTQPVRPIIQIWGKPGFLSFVPHKKKCCDCCRVQGKAAVPCNPLKGIRSLEIYQSLENTKHGLLRCEDMPRQPNRDSYGSSPAYVQV